jgi:hypothetical protein
MCFLGTS